jgi:signal transduction histidine kinase
MRSKERYSAMLRQVLNILLYLIVSLFIGTLVTLLVDEIQNVEVDKRLRTGMESTIKDALSSYKESSTQHTSNEDIIFIKKFVATVMKDKIIARQRGSGDIPETYDHDLYIFTMKKNEDYTFDFYLQKDYLKSELAILDVPDYISGVVATIVLFTSIVLYIENKKRIASIQHNLEIERAELASALEQHEAMALLGRMSAALAHELKTPIATISNLVQTLPSRHSDEQFISRFVELTHEELNRTQQLIDNLLAYGKDIHIRNSEWIEVESMLTEASDKTITLDIPQKFMMYGDSFYLGLLFKNLLRNSREAGADKVDVRVKLSATDDKMHAEIICDDNGAGFPPLNDMDKLTDPFVTSRSQGGGLGLYLAKKIAAAHGGSLSLARMDKGARVIITVPVNRIRLENV